MENNPWQKLRMRWNIYKLTDLWHLTISISSKTHQKRCRKGLVRRIRSALISSESDLYNVFNYLFSLQTKPVEGVIYIYVYMYIYIYIDIVADVCISIIFCLPTEKKRNGGPIGARVIPKSLKIKHPVQNMPTLWTHPPSCQQYKQTYTSM